MLNPGTKIPVTNIDNLAFRGPMDENRLMGVGRLPDSLLCTDVSSRPQVWTSREGTFRVDRGVPSRTPPVISGRRHGNVDLTHTCVISGTCLKEHKCVISRTLPE